MEEGVHKEIKQVVKERWKKVWFVHEVRVGFYNIGFLVFCYIVASRVRDCTLTGITS